MPRQHASFTGPNIRARSETPKCSCLTASTRSPSGPVVVLANGTNSPSTVRKSVLERRELEQQMQHRVAPRYPEVPQELDGIRG